MARMDLRARAFAWLTRRQGSVAAMTDEQVVALQKREMPDSRVTNWIFGARPSAVALKDQLIPGPGGDLPVRVYRTGPGPDPDRRPLVIYFHGGGFVLGGLRMGDWLCGNVAAQVGAVVVSVDYRLAPRHPFPVAVEDCYAALAWAAGSAELGARGPVGVMGESAGGNLSAVVALAARDRGGPAIAHQALLYPATDMSDSGTSLAAARASRNPAFVHADEIEAYQRMYLGADGDASSPLASPILAPSHEGLPPALVIVGEHDPLHDDGVRYAQVLKAAGVPVRLTDYLGMPHGFLNFPGLCRSAPQALSELIAEQKAAFAVAGQSVS
ncbi:MAG TPA: alpha/beta hydrolase [Trebonia sp.]|nr:alpha/beta hydrolase [Trebonia sp.]